MKTPIQLPSSARELRKMFPATHMSMKDMCKFSQFQEDYEFYVGQRVIARQDRTLQGVILEIPEENFQDIVKVIWLSQYCVEPNWYSMYECYIDRKEARQHYQTKLLEEYEIA